jgi:hypothetical protein
MPRTKLAQNLGLGEAPLKGQATGRLRLVSFTMCRSDLQEFERLLSAGRKTPLTRQLWFSGIKKAIQELLQDIDVSLVQGVKVSTSSDENTSYEGYRKITKSDAKTIIAGQRKFHTVVSPVDRKYLYGLPEIKGYNPTYYLERYMPERDRPTVAKVELNTKLIEELIAIRDKYDIYVRDLISLAVERKAARLRATGLYSDEEHVERPIEIDADKNDYKSYSNAFEGMQEEKL